MSLGERDELAFRLAAGEHEVPAALLQRLAQLLQALEHELRARAGGVPAVQQRVVEHEHRHHALARVERGAQRRVVVHAQVAPEPDEGGRGHRPSVRTRGLDWIVVELVRDFPLFPLGLVALPSELIPLHIFEERYKTMIGHCLEQESEFGIVWLADDGLRPIGCACEVAEVLERLPDGRINLVARGTRVFRIDERQDELPYPAGTVEFLDDRDELADPEAAEGAHSAYADLVEQATDRTPEPGEIEAMSAYEMAATVEFGLDAKQGLLDLRSETARMKLVTRLCRAAIKRLDFIDRAQSRARSNGKVHFSG